MEESTSISRDRGRRCWAGREGAGVLCGKVKRSERKIGEEKHLGRTKKKQRMLQGRPSDEMTMAGDEMDADPRDQQEQHPAIESKITYGGSLSRC